MFGTVELPDKPIMLPPFVEATHCLGYHLTRKGRAVADRVVSVLGYACPDITYSPSLYPITAALLHFMPGEFYYTVFVLFSILVMELLLLLNACYMGCIYLLWVLSSSGGLIFISMIMRMSIIDEIVFNQVCYRKLLHVLGKSDLSLIFFINLL